jgi:hypothetical protein
MSHCSCFWAKPYLLLFCYAMCFTEKQQIPVLYSGLLCASQRSNKYQLYTLVCYVLHREATNTSCILWFAMCFTEKQQIPVLYSGLLCASQRSNKYQFYTLVWLNRLNPISHVVLDSNVIDYSWLQLPQLWRDQSKLFHKISSLFCFSSDS